jgi:hypothetical protein
VSFSDLQRRMQIRPIQNWPGELTPDSRRRPSPFSAEWPSTRTLLDRELEAQGATAVVLHVAYDEADLRLDGLPYARAQAHHPGVVLSFNRDGNPRERLQFATDRFDRWQDNVRAIALALEALRKVDRYGVTSGGQQYAGFKAIPQSTDPADAIQTAAQAHAYLDEQWDGDVRRALYATHPDRGGDEDEFRKVQRARELIGA